MDLRNLGNETEVLDICRCSSCVPSILVSQWVYFSSCRSSEPSINELLGLPGKPVEVHIMHWTWKCPHLQRVFMVMQVGIFLTPSGI